MEPWDIWNQYFRGGAHKEDADDGDDDEKKNNRLYLFTPLKKRTATGSRLDRSVGSNGGTWHEDNVGRESQTLGGAVLWTVKRFSYRTKKNKKEEDKGTQLTFTAQIYIRRGVTSLSCFYLFPFLPPLNLPFLSQWRHDCN
ncbi:unnamed protein product [Linum trigynum]|uniref:Uncharacterized protein n=1 Tax=Linum trigynum TaxID=586398 RepID=A0AAV2GPK9_9ROSI